ncbi:MAG: YkgJ family cysteine cluster protein [Nitrospiraceae bacterium]|nr:YkgJ family cysteine cluster protein [Nitrospiraceae bacterium]MSR25329.1 YkgJ family cysteine cluster protein [Nitrospiraceae bacterium]
MEPTHPPEQFNLSIKTPAGPVTTTVEISTGFVPVTQIVPLMRKLGEQAESLEQQRAVASGQKISCAKGCAACCRMLVPVSAPEAFALRDMVAALSENRRQVIRRALADTTARLEQAGLLSQLRHVAETDRAITDDAMEPINRAYYALKLPCPYLENEACSIYEDRPAACRELLVTSPADWCQDMVNKPIRALPVPLRVSTILGMLWSDLTGSPPRLIPLPLALDWADRHAAENRASWKARDLLDKALDTIWRFLSQQPAR